MTLAANPGLGKIGGLEPPQTLTGRFGITDVWPNVESGRRPVKAVVGEELQISAVAFREGHDSLSVDVVVVDPNGGTTRHPMSALGNSSDKWETRVRFGSVEPEDVGDWGFTISAWDDPIQTWQHRASIKLEAGVDEELELAEGALVFDRVLAGLPAEAAQERTLIAEVAQALRDTTRPPMARLSFASAHDVASILSAYPLRDIISQSGPWPVRVQRRRALFGSWYEFFPRSEGASTQPVISGTFKTAQARLPAIAEMGFDVVYLPPIHPIGEVNRKGRNNSLTPHAGDPGSPWAIGSEAGGHDQIHPDLGTLADFTAFVSRANELGMQIALDLALQAAPDHPWARQHPEWFTTRADGTIAYAENPPKKYQDIYPLNFDNDPEGLYAEIVRITRLWMSRGVRIFRVDNPHTKPLWLWERLFADIHATDPDVIFLAEAFTLPAMMRALGSVGFTQSYTYFTWRNSKPELTEYLEELSGPAAPYMRPNFFVNTPDILPDFLQTGGPAAFAIRATLAAGLSPTWGLYSGFELYENIAIRSDSEDYLDSEKYQYRPRDWAAAQAGGQTLVPYITQLNRIRRDHPALQQLRNLTFHHVDDSEVIAFSKRDGDDQIIVICTLDPHNTRETTMWLDMPALGHDWFDTLTVTDEITGATWNWKQNVYVRLDPFSHVAHIVRIHGQ